MYEEVLKLYDKLVELNPDFERKGKTMPYTSANGHMFSLLNKDGELGIRLSKESEEKFKETYNAEPFMSHGAVMRGYVCIPEALHGEVELLAAYLKEGHEYVLSLPPKATKKKKK